MTWTAIQGESRTSKSFPEKILSEENSLGTRGVLGEDTVLYRKVIVNMNIYLELVLDMLAIGFLVAVITFIVFIFEEKEKIREMMQEGKE